MSDSIHSFARLAAINVNEHVERKGGFAYLSWPYAVAQLRAADPTAVWEVRRFDGLPFLATEAGVFVEVAVTVQGITLSQIHPVLDARRRQRRHRGLRVGRRPEPGRVEDRPGRSAEQAVPGHRQRPLHLLRHDRRADPEHRAPVVARGINPAHRPEHDVQAVLFTHRHQDHVGQLAYLAKAGTEVDLTGGVIAAQTGTIQASYIAQSGATLLEFATPEETIGAVRNGEADAVLADRAYLEPIAAEDADLDFTGDSVLIGGGVGMGLRESDAELKEKFNAAIQSMKDDGSLNALITKWEIGETF